ncbi:PAS domain-containing protein [Methylopila sp. M107]|uniref:PAS domain-containing protein n=1 Tax=Methylopila sp. M107 TaxID=1101190 RepID=UPI0009DC2401|nr:PAS domain-containing protein [Methylopila sp. M107]
MEDNISNDNIPLSVILWDALDVLHMPVCQLSDAGVILRFNQAWRWLVEDAFEGQPLIQSILPEDRYHALSQFRSIDEEQEAQDIECRVMTGRNSSRWHLLSLRPSQDGWLCVATDIHALKHREAELERRAAVQSQMLDVSVDCIKLISLDGALLHMNKAGCQALGVEEQSGFGMPWLGLLPESVRRDGEQALRAARTGRSARFAGSSVLDGQEPQYWDNMLSPVLGAKGAATAILCVSREVTAEKKALTSLQASRDRLAMAARVGRLGIWDYDIELDRLHCDENWYRIMGRDPATPITSIAEFRPLIHPDDVEKATEVSNTIADLASSERDYSVEFRIIRPDGEIRWLRSEAGLEKTDGRVSRAMGFVVDITEARYGGVALLGLQQFPREESLAFASRRRGDR